MTKLEQKLIQLGYEKTKFGWRKRLKDRFIIELHIFTNNEVVGGIIQEESFVMYQCQINRLQHAFDVMQKDLELLKECEE